ncbi:MAG TPA: hypothetical protein PKU99_09245 [Candidatus Saccharicenans sp.]|nr:hypothetical protein [Candidatus Saccharicenans sp.]
MSFFSILKMPLKNHDSGSALVVCLLVMAIFTSLGLGWLTSSQIFLQVEGSRKVNRLTLLAAENGLKVSLELINEHLQQSCSGQEIDEDAFQRLRDRLLSGETLLAGSDLDKIIEAKESYDDFSQMTWQVSTSIENAGLEDFEQYLRSTCRLIIDATGQVQGFTGQRSEEVVALLTFYTGHLPLDRLSAAIEEEGISEESKEKIKLVSSKEVVIGSDLPLTLSKGTIPDDALPLISRGLRLFKPDGLPNWLLRQALGLPSGPDPVPDGVYLIKDDLGPGGIFVQGSLDELLLGIQAEWQIIQFKQEEKIWQVKFSPATRETIFISPGGLENFNWLLIPLVMINGRVDNLACGQPGFDGLLSPAAEEDTISILAGCQLAIVSSSKINITTNLKAQGLDWKEGVPYLRQKDSPLIIWSTGKDFQTEELVDGGINIFSRENSPLTIAGNLVAGGEGLKVNNPGKGTVQIVGGLVTTRLETGKNELTVFTGLRDQSGHENPDAFHVLSNKALVHLSEFKIVEWRSQK